MTSSLWSSAKVKIIVTWKTNFHLSTTSAECSPESSEWPFDMAWYISSNPVKIKWLSRTTLWKASSRWHIWIMMWTIITSSWPIQSTYIGDKNRLQNQKFSIFQNPRWRTSSISLTEHCPLIDRSISVHTVCRIVGCVRSINLRRRGVRLPSSPSATGSPPLAQLRASWGFFLRI